jgi:hypothetical protein
MDGILGRLSNYHILSSVIPGAVLLILVAHMDIPSLASFTAAEQVVLAYFSGLSLNRLAAILTCWDFGEDNRKILYRTYRDDPQAQSIYDTYVMYRTFVLALPCAGVALYLAAPSSVQLAGMSRGFALGVIGALTAIFIGACLIQRGYLGQLIEEREKADAKGASPPSPSTSTSPSTTKSPN